jgi:hypothetical protein
MSRLTHRIPMVQVEDLPEAMQRQVVGVHCAQGLCTTLSTSCKRRSLLP